MGDMVKVPKLRQLASMAVAEALAWFRAPLWTHLSHTHNALLASVEAVGDGSQPYYHGLVSRA